MAPRGEGDDRHRCDEACRCPVDGEPLLWWPRGRQHACQRPDCQYAHGFPPIAIWRDSRGRKATPDAH